MATYQIRKAMKMELIPYSYGMDFGMLYNLELSTIMECQRVINIEHKCRRVRIFVLFFVAIPKWHKLKNHRLHVTHFNEFHFFDTNRPEQGRDEKKSQLYHFLFIFKPSILWNFFIVTSLICRQLALWDSKKILVKIFFLLLSLLLKAKKLLYILNIFG